MARDAVLGKDKGRPGAGAAAAGINARRRLLDKAGRAVATASGLLVSGAVVALVGFLVKEALPLLAGATATPRAELSFAEAGVEARGGALAAGVDERKERAFVLGRDGTFEVVDLVRGRRVSAAFPFEEEERPGAAGGPETSGEGRTARSALSFARYVPEERRVVYGTGDGRAGVIDVEFTVGYAGSELLTGFTARAGEEIALDPRGRAIAEAAFARAGTKTAAAGIAAGDRSLLLYVRQESRSLLGGGPAAEYTFDLTSGLRGEATAVALAPDAATLLAGTSAGLLYQWSLQDPARPRLVAEIVASGPGAGGLAEGGATGSAAVTALRFLTGGQTVVVGDAAGGVAAWFEVAGGRGEARRLRRVHELEAHGAPVVHIAPSQRNRTFVTVDAQGVAALHHATSARTLLAVPTGVEAAGAAIAPRSDGQLILSPGGLHLWDLRAAHPEVSLKALFAPVHYEGYPGPAHVWQSSGGSDRFEPKFGLTPLAFGTLKGTVAALVFAVPLGILGAVYASQFMSPRLQAITKPAVEIMAGLPSVVLGFLAGLWLAPALVEALPGLMLMAVILPALVVACALAWRRIPHGMRSRLPKGAEAVLMIPVTMAGAAAALALGPAFEAWAMGGDFRFWLFDVFRLPYEQRNALVVGIAMGFAVIPAIFGIAEDALSSVPRSLTAGSLALGASHWQTVARVVVPCALPGIVSAVMIGVGRAAGETMIVLMATGNTPVMSTNIFEGFRALSANIAVELPEAAVGGTHYRVLFVSALLLFLFTFLLNTAGEFVRARMRRRLSRL